MLVDGITVEKGAVSAIGELLRSIILNLNHGQGILSGLMVVREGRCQRMEEIDAITTILGLCPL